MSRDVENYRHRREEAEAAGSILFGGGKKKVTEESSWNLERIIDGKLSLGTGMDADMSSTEE